MERPRSLLPLALHVVRLRWAKLGTGARVAIVAGTVALGALGVRAATCGACCASDGCPNAHHASADTDDAPCHHD